MPHYLEISPLLKDSDDLMKDLIFMAKVAEAAERYEDMCSYMQAIVTDVVKPDGGAGLEVEQRNLLSVAYKNVIGEKRASWRSLYALDEAKGNQLAVKYKARIEGEILTVCKEVLELLEKTLISNANAQVSAASSKDDAKAATEAVVFYLKMAGDYYRYLAELNQEVEFCNNSKEKYGEALRVATQPGEKGLSPTNPIRLGLALNFSVCYYEILKEPDQACKLAKDAFDLAISKLESLDEASYKDSTLIMQLLRDNLTLWTQNQQDEEGGEGTTGGDMEEPPQES